MTDDERLEKEEATRARLKKEAAEWWAFHLKNPTVFSELVDMALKLHGRGFAAWTIWNLASNLRYTHAMDSGVDLKFPNAHFAYYSRFIIQEEPLLDGFFRVKGDVELPPEALALEMARKNPPPEALALEMAIV